MADPRMQVHILLRSMVNKCFETQTCAAKEVADFWHPLGNAGDSYNTADLSLKMSGSRQWTTGDVMALQAITGSQRVTDAMARVGQAVAPVCSLSSLQHAHKLIREASLGTSALLDVSEGGSRAEAIAELQDLIEAAQAAKRDMETKLAAEGSAHG